MTQPDPLVPPPLAVPFTGTISEGGAVVMINRYLGQHQVDYLGSYDGEGTMFGEWRIGPMKDRWLITFRRPDRAKAEEGDKAGVID